MRNRNRSRRDNTSTSNGSGVNDPFTSTSNSANIGNDLSPRRLSRLAKLSRSRKSSSTPFTSAFSMPSLSWLPTRDITMAWPFISGFQMEDRRDSAISSTWESAEQNHKRKSEVTAWFYRGLSWTPCRTIRWLYHMFVDLARACWHSWQTFTDLALTVLLLVICVIAGYVVLEFLLKALPGVAAQAIDGNCSVVYVTVPGPIITISLVAASPSNPARGTYYFSVVNSTTHWLDSIAPPSRFSTLITRTPEITPAVSSLSVTRSPYPTVSSTGISTIPSLSIPGLLSSSSSSRPPNPGSLAPFHSSSVSLPWPDTLCVIVCLWLTMLVHLATETLFTLFSVHQHNQQ